MINQKFFKPTLLVLGTNMISGRTSDHSRQPVSESFKRIETTNRMANGILRKYYVATKHEFQASWDLLPHAKSNTVDGFMGALDLKAFYDANYGAFDLTIVSGQLAKPGDFAYEHPADAPTGQRKSFAATKYLVHFTDFSLEIAKRGQSYDMYNVSMSMEEI
ncbi:MAG: hypothetical protein EOO61_11750 [Hymenobacter sp.]|nr:MAG: hypothetical protein EOO61_11750 [Hymenobacter sp.]